MQYLEKRMGGSHWIDCEQIAVYDDAVLIKFFDYFFREFITKAVDKSLIRV